MLKRAVDIGGVEMVIEEKAKKEEEKVDVVKEKVTPQVNRTAKKANNQDCHIYQGSPQKIVNGILSQVVFLRSYQLSNVPIIQCLIVFLSSSLKTGRSWCDQGMA